MIEPITNFLVQTLNRYRYREISMISCEALQDWLEEKESSIFFQQFQSKPLVLDIRTEEEYEISHIKEAIRVDPNNEIWTDFYNHYSMDTPIVTYCSLSNRSSKIALQLQENGYKHVFNLDGSIFTWINEERTVVNNQNQTVSKIHPFSTILAFLFVNSAHVVSSYKNVSTSKKNSLKQRPRVVLLGSGHGTLLVVKHLVQQKAPVELIMVSEKRNATYSGMIPGLVADQYTKEETQVPTDAFLHWANQTVPSKFILGKAVSIQVKDKQVIYNTSDQKEERINFDVLLIDVGSSTRGVDELKGAKEFAIPTRPISNLIDQIKKKEEELQRKTQANIVVTGSGAAGVELCNGVIHRLKKRFGDDFQVKVTLITGEKSFLETLQNSSLAEKARKVLQDKGVEILEQVKTVKFEKSKVYLSNDSCIDNVDMALLATGAQPVPFNWTSSLTLNKEGFIQVNSYLQSIDANYIFAVGDCCNIITFETPIPKAGILAVRQGHFIWKNILHYLKKEPLEVYQHNSRALRILNTGDGSAISDWNGYAMQGSLIFKWKDYIDQSWMKEFVLGKELDTRENMIALAKKKDEEDQISAP